MKRLRKAEQELHEKVETQEGDLQQARQCVDAARMADSLRKLRRTLEGIGNTRPANETAKVQIRNVLMR